MQTIHAIIGLGNPGAEYAATRHNIGWMVTDKILEKFRGQWRPGKGKFLYSQVKIGGRNIYVLRSTTYMNNSGIGVLDAIDKLDIIPQELLVVLDDFALPFGTIRIRKQGSDGGHNGLSSIIYHLETEEFPRLRIGIGPVPENADTIDFVLGEFTPDERESLPEIINKSVNAVVVAVRQNIERAMELYNRKKQIEQEGNEK